jgi:hypothetical protein
MKNMTFKLEIMIITQGVSLSFVLWCVCVCVCLFLCTPCLMLVRQVLYHTKTSSTTLKVHFNFGFHYTYFAILGKPNILP